MALLICPDCGATVSDAAQACLQCGNPLGSEGFQVAGEHDQPLEQVRPWVRYFARMLDYFLASIVSSVVLAVVSPVYFASEDSEFGVTWLALLVWIPIEAVLLATWGTTPGKALLRTRIVPTDGDDSIDFATALNRATRVWFSGVGTGFPIVFLFTMGSAYGKLNKTGSTSWDQELGFNVEHRKIGPARVAVALVILVGVAALNFISA